MGVPTCGLGLTYYSALNSSLLTKSPLTNSVQTWQEGCADSRNYLVFGDGMYAVWDYTPAHNQVPVTLGQRAKAGIDVHFWLRDFPPWPRSPRRTRPVQDDKVPEIPVELLEQAVDFHTYVW